MPEKFPSPSQCIEILKTYNIELNIIQHSIRVCEIASLIAKNIINNGNEIDLAMVKAGALLHDIGRAKIHDITHGYEGGNILRELGYPKLALIAERHVIGGISKRLSRHYKLPNRNYIPRSLEEIVVCYADKLCSGTELTTIENRFEDWRNKHGGTELLFRGKKRMLKFQKKLRKLTAKQMIIE